MELAGTQVAEVFLNQGAGLSINKIGIGRVSLDDSRLKLGLAKIMKEEGGPCFKK